MPYYAIETHDDRGCVIACDACCDAMEARGEKLTGYEVTAYRCELRLAQCRDRKPLGFSARIRRAELLPNGLVRLEFYSGLVGLVGQWGSRHSGPRLTEYEKDLIRETFQQQHAANAYGRTCDELGICICDR